MRTADEGRKGRLQLTCMVATVNDRGLPDVADNISLSATWAGLARWRSRGAGFFEKLVMDLLLKMGTEAPDAMRRAL